MQTKTILERHLKIGESLSEDDLVRVSEAEGGVKMLRSYPDMTFVRVDGAEGNADAYLRPIFFSVLTGG